MNTLPKGMKTDWNLELLYKSATDPRIGKDVRTIEKLCRDFSKKYRSVDFAKKPTVLQRALADYESLVGNESGARAMRYCWFRKELNASDDVAEAQLRLLGERLTKAGNQTTFFELALGHLPAPQQKKLLGDKRFAHFRYFLERVFKTARYNLTEAEENLLSRTGAFGGRMWSDGVEKALNNRSVVWDGKAVPLQEAIMGVVHKHAAQERHQLWQLVVEKLHEVDEFAESEINALYSKKKTLDEMRKLPKPYTATILGYENSERSVLSLVRAVTEAYPLSHRFHRIKKKLLKLKQLRYVDRSAPYVAKELEAFPFARSYELVHCAFSSAGPVYADILDRYLHNGQIDVASKKGKSGGAYCAGARTLPTFVLLNHTDDLNSTMTLAHEMGHAIHGEFAKKQTPLYDGYSTSVAETASTFFETWAFDHIARELPKEMRTKLLHDRLQDQIATVFRQVACFNFELELHETIRKEGWVPKERIALLMQKHLQAYLGPDVEVTPEDGYTFVYWSHIRNYFYVYTYAYGQLISNALVDRVHRDPVRMREVDQFLEAGASDTPENIFKNIGISLEQPKFWKQSLKNIEAQIDELEKLL